MSDQSAPPELSSFQILFESALRDYENQTGKTWAQHPLSEQLEHCNSIESVSDFLQQQARAFSGSRGSDGRIMKSLDCVVSVLYTLSAETVLGGTVGLTFPAAQPIFAAFAILLAAAKGVNACYDALVDLLELVEQFLNRLEIYTKVTLSRPMVEMIVKIMVQLLHVLGLVTKEIKQKRLIKFGKKLLGENDVEVALQILDRLTLEESRTTAAQTLEQVDGLVQDMREVKDDGKVLSKTIQQVASALNKSGRDKVEEDIRSWLSPPDPWKNHNIACESRHSGTAAWFLQSKSFSEWKSSALSSLLWIHGKPGAGKSILCSTIIEDIDAMRKSGLASLAFFYCDFREEQKKDRRALLSSLLVQLCHQSDSYCDVLSNFYLEHAKGSRHPRDDALVRCLRDIIKLPGQPPLYIIVDALDECPNASAMPSPREKVLMLVEELVESHLPNLRVCVTSRPETDIKAVLDPLTFRSISLHNESGQIQDIDSYIRSVADTDPKMRRWKAEIREPVIDVLTKKADGMFRWVYCQVVYLRGCLPGRIRRALEDLPETLDETYERTLGEINKANWEFAHRLLQCVAVAFRPLHAEELAEFLAFDFKAGPIPTFCEDWRPEDPMDAVLSTCSSLLVVVKVEDSSVIQFAHFSVKEYLTCDRLSIAKDIISRYHISMTPAHTLVAQSCLGILLHLPKGVTRESLKDFPLVEYAAEHWIDHARFENVIQNVEHGMRRLFDPNKSHLAVWVWIHDPGTLWWGGSEQAELPLAAKGMALHYAALCGLGGIAEVLITEHSQDVHSRGFDNESTPLYVASCMGHVEVARVLLKHGADPTTRDRTGWSPLHGASSGGHAKLASLLLEHGGDLEAQDDGGRTPLYWASYTGQIEVVRVLLERGANPSAQPSDGSTPLHGTLWEVYVDVARVLLQYGADPSAPDRQGLTPLHRASSDKEVELARVLLEYGADVTAQARGGLTSLHQAAERGQVKLARVLLEHGADARAEDAEGRNPLHGASSGGYVEFAEVLLQHGADVKAQDGEGSTPLHLASSGGHVGLAQVLLEHGANVTTLNRRGTTALHLASEGGHVELARVLLQHGAGATARDNSGSTPLHGASFRGHSDLARILLEHGADAAARDGDKSTPLHEASSEGDIELVRNLLKSGADPTAQDRDGLTPLHGASSEGHIELARVLLKHGASATAQDGDGSTPLLGASYWGQAELARVLLEHGADSTARDGNGSTPLHEASYWGHVEFARVLLEHGGDPTARDEDGATPLHRASSEGHVKLVGVLLEHGTDAAAQDGEGRTPLHLVSDEGHVELARVLLHYGADATARDGDGSTPLHAASSEGHVELACVLFEHGADVAAQDGDGSTPLHTASYWGQVELACVLLENGADPTAQDGDGMTPLHLASFGGQAELTRVLLEHGADPTAQDRKGSTPLHEASSEGHIELAQVLLEHGADPTVQDWDGSTPLHGALSEGHIELALVLIENGADTTAQDRDGRTPLHWLSDGQHVELAHVLP